MWAHYMLGAISKICNIYAYQNTIVRTLFRAKYKFSIESRDESKDKQVGSSCMLLTKLLSTVYRAYVVLIYLNQEFSM